MSVVVVMCGCGMGPGKIAGGGDEPCEMELDGKRYFIGAEKCFRAFSPQPLSGYWVRAFEYSAFYKSRSSIKAGYDPDAIWLDLSQTAYDMHAHLWKEGEVQVFEIKFVGIDPDRDGWYGGGTHDRGILAERITSIRELPELSRSVE